MINTEFFQTDLMQLIIGGVIALYALLILINLTMWLLGYRGKNEWGHEYANKHIKRNCDCWQCKYD
jgi:hypothetical protein